MTIKPIDLQVMMPKTIEVSRVQQSTKESSETQKKLLTVQFQEQLQTAKQKVNKRSKVKDTRIEVENNQSKRDAESKKQNKKRRETKSHKKKRHHYHVDIKI